MTRMLLKKSILNVRMLLAVLISFMVLSMSLFVDGRMDAFLPGLSFGTDLLSLYTIPFAFSSFVIFAGLFPGLPYAYSYLEEKNSGYLKFVLPRMSRKTYAAQKIVFTGLSGGLAMMLPGILVFILLDLTTFDTTPAYYPSVFDDLYWAPLMFIWGGRLVLLIKAALMFFFGVMWSEVALLTALLVKNKYVAYVIPFLVFEFLWIAVGPSMYNPIFLIRADFDKGVPLYTPFLIDGLYIVLLVIANWFIFKRRCEHEGF